MTRQELSEVRVGDVVLVRMRVVALPKPGTVADARGWLTCEPVANDDWLLSDQVEWLAPIGDVITVRALRKQASTGKDVTSE